MKKILIVQEQTDNQIYIAVTNVDGDDDQEEKNCYGCYGLSQFASLANESTRHSIVKTGAGSKKDVPFQKCGSFGTACFTEEAKVDDNSQADIRTHKKATDDVQKRGKTIEALNVDKELEAKEYL